MKKELEISKMLTLSTGHISEETAKFLHDESQEYLVVYPKLEYGWFIHLGTADEELEQIPQDLAKLIVFAKENGCDWLCLDCDGYTVEGLPVYDW